MEECWDDEFEDSTAVGQNNAVKYVPPFKRSDEYQRDVWNNSSSTNQQYPNQSHQSQNRSNFSDRQHYSERQNYSDHQHATGGPRQSRGNQYDSNRSDDSIEVEIDSSKVGKVIGRGGSKIQELENESGARIKILKEESSNSVLTAIRITGTPTSREKAKVLIEELTAEFRGMSSNSTRNYDQSASNSNSFYKPNQRDGFQAYNSNGSDDSIEIEVDSSKVGKVIGRGGSKIQELQNESGARINISKEESSNFGLTAIRITGSPTSREKAKVLIEELTADFRGMSFNSTSNYEQSTTNSNSFYKTNQSDDFEVIDWGSIIKESEEAQKKKLASLPPIIKEFYKEDPEVKAMSKQAVADFRRTNNNISVCRVNEDDDRPIPNPVNTFKQAFQNYPELLEELSKQKFTTPSPIQSQAWPILLSGYDMIGIAQTGTGKTIAFLFPALIHIVHQVTPRHQRTGPTCLILAPTRELAQQIEVETKKYSYHNINCVCIYGGGSRKNQIGIVTKGVDIVIATPGRLNDLVMNKIVDVTSVSYLVLDEADRMLDMGFEPQIRKIVLDIRPDRQTVMTSATWTSEIQSLAGRYMVKPFKVNVGALDLAAVHSVSQEIVFADDEQRRELLEEFIDNMGPEDKVIVFVERKSIADHLSSDLLLQGISLQSIHGDREQCDREQALDDMKTGFVRILIATDVASRGLDIKDITHVFNMYFPRNIEEYVHRVGRTGRAGRTGHAISIFTRQDWMHAAPLIKILEEANQYVPDELYQMADRYKAWKQKKMAEEEAYGGRRGRGGRRRF